MCYKIIPLLISPQPFKNLKPILDSGPNKNKWWTRAGLWAIVYRPLL